MDMQKRLRKFLASVDSHAGRGSSQMQRLARRSKISIHTIQSIAYGRRGGSELSLRRLGNALDLAEKARDMGYL